MYLGILSIDIDILNVDVEGGQVENVHKKPKYLEMVWKSLPFEIDQLF